VESVAGIFYDNEKTTGRQALPADPEKKGSALMENRFRFLF
jgi:hypothetical protein